MNQHNRRRARAVAIDASAHDQRQAVVAKLLLTLGAVAVAAQAAIVLTGLLHV